MEALAVEAEVEVVAVAVEEVVGKLEQHHHRTSHAVANLSLALAPPHLQLPHPRPSRPLA